jgi:hypothetical protein
MTLLREIQDAAVSSEVPITDLLRKCKILATRLGNEEFRAWVDHELNGYPSDDSLPDYRILEVQSKGHFSGVAGSSLRNAPIPPSNIPKEFRHIATTAHCREPISAYVELLRGDRKSDFQSPWPTDLVKHVATKIYEHMSCLSAWREIPRGGIVAIVDTVRNRVLNFALEIEAADPNAGEASPSTQSVSPEKVTQVFHTNIYGGVGNLAAGSEGVTQQSATVVRHGDFASLQAYLAELGIADPEIHELREALQADEPDRGAKEIGPRAGTWVGRMIARASAGALKVGTSVASNVLTKAISQYLGLPG